MGKKKKKLMAEMSKLGKKGKKDKDKNKKKFKKLRGSSLSKKERGICSKLILKPVKIPEKIADVREHCNHLGSELLTPAQYKEMTPLYMHYTPMLTRLCDVYGDNNVGVCPYCFDAVVKPSAIDMRELSDAIAALYGLASSLVTTQNMGNKEMREISELKDSLSKWDSLLQDMMESSRKRSDDDDEEAKLSRSIH